MTRQWRVSAAYVKAARHRPGGPRYLSAEIMRLGESPAKR